MSGRCRRRRRRRSIIVASRGGNKELAGAKSGLGPFGVQPTASAKRLSSSVANLRGKCCFCCYAIAIATKRQQFGSARPPAGLGRPVALQADLVTSSCEILAASCQIIIIISIELSLSALFKLISQSQSLQAKTPTRTGGKVSLHCAASGRFSSRSKPGLSQRPD